MPKNMKGVMKEFAGGKLHSGSKKGPVVKSKKQAIAIGLSQQKKAKGGSPIHKAMGVTSKDGY